MHPRTHELFPSANEVKENPSLVYSDHLPAMFDVPLSEKNEKPLRIISWNILGYNAASGFHDVLRGWETEEQGRERYGRLCQSLKLFIQKHQPDLLLLQEVQPEIMPDLNDLLPGYTVHDSGYGPMTLAKNPVDDSGFAVSVYDDPDLENRRGRVRFNNVCNGMGALQTLSLVRGNTEIHVHHVHTQFYDTPENHELFYTHLLNKNTQEVTPIVVGDTNTRVAPRDNINLHNIITGVIPMGINQTMNVEKGVQMTDFPDAAFIKNSDSTISQVDRVILDYRSGDIFDMPDMVPLDIQPKWYQFRMLMCLTDYDDINNKIHTKNVFEIQNDLRTQFPESDVIVRMAAKDNNERGYAFGFTDRNDPLCVSLMESGFAKAAQDEPANFQRQLYDNPGTGQPSCNLFVHRDVVDRFILMLNKVTFKDNISQIDACIERIRGSRFNLFLRNGNDKIIRLQNLKDNILAAPIGSNITSIINAWQGELMDVNGVKKTNAAVTAERRNRFVGTFLYSAASAPKSTMHVMIDNMKACI
tara:strand:- start:1181 stop:2767 length:1587 start_codon:yes stop_codon:yes gene_type:complete